MITSLLFSYIEPEFSYITIKVNFHFLFSFYLNHENEDELFPAIPSIYVWKIYTINEYLSGCQFLILDDLTMAINSLNLTT